MRLLAAAFTALSTLALAHPALACGLDEPVRPVVSFSDGNRLLTDVRGAC